MLLAVRMHCIYQGEQRSVLQPDQSSTITSWQQQFTAVDIVPAGYYI